MNSIRLVLLTALILGAGTNAFAGKPAQDKDGPDAKVEKGGQMKTMHGGRHKIYVERPDGWGQTP